MSRFVNKLNVIKFSQRSLNGSFCTVGQLANKTEQNNCRNYSDRNNYYYNKVNKNNSYYYDFNEDNGSKKYLVLGTAALVWAFYEAYKIKENEVFMAKKDVDVSKIGEFKEGLPTYKEDEVRKHSDLSTGVWVTYKNGVYDITKFIPKHPGGDQITLAAGSSVEPFWMIYGVHKSPEILEMLETYRIGNLDPDEKNDATLGMEDFYANEPKRHGILKPTSVKPFNAEPPPSILVDSNITPNEIFFVRNHLPVPEVNVNEYEISVEVEGKRKALMLNLNDLKKMPKHTITAVTMCAGNRRSEMVEIKPVKGLNWGSAAVGNATWTGVKLRDVLKLQGIDTKDEAFFHHVQFEGLDTDPTHKPYGASIPIWKALDPRGDVILAYEMNGKPIPRDHGYPVRVIVPGTVGARNVKWLSRIVVSKHESDSHWQQNDYKGFSPSVDWHNVDFTKSPAIQELPVISAICKPVPGSTVKVEDGCITVQGYAWSGGGKKIVRVDVTVDQGDTWVPAEFDYQDVSEPPQHWAWSLWSVKIPVPKKAKCVEIWAKATDSSYNTQPESFKNIWNLRGVLGNAYHRVKVDLKQ